MKRKLMLLLSIMIIVCFVGGCSTELSTDNVDNIKKIGTEVSGTVKDVVTDEEFQKSVKDAGNTVKDVITDEDVQESVKGVIDAVGNAASK